ncbi:MAG: response regulator [Acidobacteria bacterium]|nr:response regulator [Acidobacteriota bacterium]
MERQTRILVVDDEEIVGKRLLVALKSSGYDVDTFVDPKAALARIAEQEYDIVVTDVRMKDVDGIQILEAVTKRSPRTKVVLITAYATIEVAREAVAKGVFDFIPKPFKVSEFLDVIARATAGAGL